MGKVRERVRSCRGVARARSEILFRPSRPHGPLPFNGTPSAPQVCERAPAARTLPPGEGPARIAAVAKAAARQEPGAAIPARYLDRAPSRPLRWVQSREPNRPQPRRTEPDSTIRATAVDRQRPQCRVSEPSRQPYCRVLSLRPAPFQRFSLHTVNRITHSERGSKSSHYGRRGKVRHPEWGPLRLADLNLCKCFRLLRFTHGLKRKVNISPTPMAYGLHR